MASSEEEVRELEDIANAAIDLGRPVTKQEKALIKEKLGSSHGAVAYRARMTEATLKSRGLWK